MVRRLNQRSDLLLIIDFAESPPRKRFYERVSPIWGVFAWKRLVIVCGQVEEIQHFIAPGEAPPSMILNRTDDEDGLRLPSSTTRKLSSRLGPLKLLTLSQGSSDMTGSSWKQQNQAR